MTNELLAWVSGGGALAIALVVWFPWMRASLNHDTFVMVVKKLLAAGNPDRVRKLCSVAPNAPFVVACGAALTAYTDGADDAASERPRRIREAFDGALRTELARVGRYAWLATIAVAAGGVCLYLVVLEGAAPWSLSLVGMGLLAIMQARQIGLKIAIAAGNHRDALVEAMLASPKA